MFIIVYTTHEDILKNYDPANRYCGPFATANDAVAYGGTNDNTWFYWDVFELEAPKGVK